ncbi:hypothetical protein ACFV4M_04065 [Kitasatospora indigofera]|uniref:hypothetical protein n=1 Tax=Kitasatospora indigofera TaxID=67307 RepID=UPI003663C9A7
MDSTALLGLAGIGGTVVVAGIGVVGTLGSARATASGQAALEEQKARRQVYAACATAVLGRRDTAVGLLDRFRDDDFSVAAAQARLDELEELRGVVAGAVGAVVVEGPYGVAHCAESAALHVEVLAARLRDWVSAVAAGRDREELVASQMRYAREDQGLMELAVDRLGAECRRVLHPDERDSPARPALWRRLLPRA